VWQALPSGWQRPALQLPPQQEAESVQARLSAMHAPALQRPAVQDSEQHSVDAWQLPPVNVHLLMEATQVAEAGSHSPEQQSPPLAHCWPKARQKGEMMTSPGVDPSRAPPTPGGVLPTLAVLLHATRARNAATKRMGVRMKLGMATPNDSSVGVQ
jgi:hypothetical protein